MMKQTTIFFIALIYGMSVVFAQNNYSVTAYDSDSPGCTGEDLGGVSGDMGDGGGGCQATVNGASLDIGILPAACSVNTYTDDGCDDVDDQIFGPVDDPTCFTPGDFSSFEVVGC
ncbi:hypothetical protein BT96DRAFT_975054 [Gymnopus androsaceus JB14]|uniref:Uncharacterized protein n=1 Tax=Gymnopus androsaceus JB14 TaxID=1447944 RepID=A0A6A4HSB8_9AGAR|nr:hypothetical protein BT96DRAFT_975054 [Gymnopus androsaceus JB14]